MVTRDTAGEDEDRVQRIRDDRRAEAAGSTRPEDSSHTDNPTFAAEEGTAVDPGAAEVDYVEEPGVGGVSREGEPRP